MDILFHVEELIVAHIVLAKFIVSLEQYEIDTDTQSYVRCTLPYIVRYNLYKQTNPVRYLLYKQALTECEAFINARLSSYFRLFKY